MRLEIILSRALFCMDILTKGSGCVSLSLLLFEDVLLSQGEQDHVPRDNERMFIFTFSLQL